MSKNAFGVEVFGEQWGDPLPCFAKHGKVVVVAEELGGVP